MASPLVDVSTLQPGLGEVTTEVDAKPNRVESQHIAASPVGRCKLAIAIVIVYWITVALDAFFLKLDILDAMYLAMQTITTIGYGDITQTGQAARLFVSLDILLQMLWISYAVTLFKMSVVTKSKRRREVRFLRAEGAGVVANREQTAWAGLVAFALFCGVIGIGTVFYRVMEHCSCSYGPTWVGGACPEEPAVFSFEDCRAAGGQVKTWIDAFYFSIVTVTTIGFGDLTPATRIGRQFALVWAPVGLVVTGYFISQLSDVLFGADEESDEEILTLDRSGFNTIDVDKNGYLSRGEFYEYLLFKHDLVSREVLDLMRAKFDKLDLNSNDQVTWDELCRVRKARQRELASHA